jgi:class 3 adenylate cyclase/CHASE2 domain-containing sensor protein
MRLRSPKHVAFVVGRAAFLILLAVGLQRSGSLVPLDNTLSDLRVRHCQADRPPPAPTLAQLDVDDNALNYIGRWPWPAKTLAGMLDEIALAQPKVVTLDVLFADRFGTVYGPNDPTGVDADATLAAAIRRLGCAVVPMSARFVESGAPSPYRRRMIPLLVANPELTEDDCLKAMRATKLDVSYLDRDPKTDTFLQIREAAFHDRIDRDVAAASVGGGRPDQAAIHRAVLPHSQERNTSSLDRLFDQQYDLVLRERALRRFTLPIPPNCPELARVPSAIVPSLPMAEAAAYSGFLDYLNEDVQGTIRSVPLIVQYHDRLVPQMSLTAACVTLGADLNAARLTDTALTIPRATGTPDLVIPVSTRHLANGAVGMLMDVPLFGRPDDWLTMYDAPRYARPVDHYSAYLVYQASETQAKLESNRADANRLLSRTEASAILSSVMSLPKARPNDPANDRRRLERAVAALATYIKNLRAEPDPDSDDKQMLEEALHAYGALYVEAQDSFGPNGLARQLEQLRAGLRADFRGKAIFFGGVATGLGDSHPTAMFDACPGIVIHGAVYNALLTGKIWRRASPATGTAVTAVAALLTLLLVTWLSPATAFVASLTLGTGYLAVNGYVLLARHDLILEAAGPTVAIALVYTGVTLTNFLAEISEHARVTRLFRSYQDPALVEYMLDHPEHIRFDGEERELTVGFSDIAGFTTLSDQLGAAVVPLLAEYMSHMTPVIRAKGTVLQQLGDGLLFLFGAPRPDPDHPANAVAAALDMHAAMATFNRTLVDRGDRPLSIRVGLATGDVVVGDAGPPDDYTYLALGATTNLAARLESANKFFGTRILVNARTADLLGHRFLLRPIANLRAVGKLSCTMVYEPLCRLADATDRDRQLADCTAEMVDAYRRADFATTRRVAAALADEFGPSKLTALYLDRAANADPERDDHCDGQIVLTEK